MIVVPMGHLGDGTDGRGMVVAMGEGVADGGTTGKGVIVGRGGLRCGVKTEGKDGNCLKAKASRSVA